MSQIRKDHPANFKVKVRCPHTGSGKRGGRSVMTAFIHRTHCSRGRASTRLLLQRQAIIGHFKLTVQGLFAFSS